MKMSSTKKNRIWQYVITLAAGRFITAAGQILYGAIQPVFGMAAIKKSNAFVKKAAASDMQLAATCKDRCRSGAGGPFGQSKPPVERVV